MAIVIESDNVTAGSDYLHGIKEFRFCVEGPSGAGFSNLWFVQTRRNDVYIGCREAGGITKVSLHESGQNHVKWTVDDDRQVISQKWTAPPFNEWGLSHVLDIAFPTNFTFSWRQGEPIKAGKKWVSMTAAAPGRAIVFSVCLAEDGAEASKFNLGYLIASLPLENKKNVCVYQRDSLFEDGILTKEKIPGLDWDKRDGEVNFAWIGWTEGVNGQPLKLVSVQGTRAIENHDVSSSNTAALS